MAPIFPKDSPLIIWAYIDGFNLYNGALKGARYKWLDLQAFSQSLRPTDTISKVKFFTAQVDARPNDPYQPARQRLYWRALRTINSIEIIEGHFLTKPTYLPEVTSVDWIASQQRAGVNTTGMRPTMAHVYRSEEKGTDVNLGVDLVHDAHLGRFDAAVVVSNDSDLARAIRIVRREVNRPVFVFNPCSFNPSHQLRQVATRFDRITERHLRVSQLPPTLSDARGSFRKPPNW